MSKLEECARALFDAAPFRSQEGDFDQRTEEYRALCRLYARAVLECLLSPDEEMLEAFFEAADPSDGPGFDLEVPAYRAMIQSILNQGNDGENR